MGIGSIFKRKHKFFKYELSVNDGNGWKKFGDYAEFLSYDDIENPPPGAILKLYGIYPDLSRKEGYARKSLWEHEVPVPGGKKAAATTKEKPIEERLMEKLVDGADFSHLQPSKLSLPFGASGGSLEFEAPVHGGSGGGGGYIMMGDSKYPVGEIPPLEFDGKMPMWMHPAAGAMIMGLIDKFSGVVKSSISGAITEATGIKARTPETKRLEAPEKEVAEPPNMVSELDDLLSEEESSPVVNVKTKAKKDIESLEDEEHEE